MYNRCEPFFGTSTEEQAESNRRLLGMPVGGLENPDFVVICLLARALQLVAYRNWRPVSSYLTGACVARRFFVDIKLN